MPKAWDDARFEREFWAKVNKTETCWLWTAANNGRYGTTSRGSKSFLVHRVAYELLVGPIPEGLTLDHVKERGCSSTLCVRPDHLEPVTQKENYRRHTQAITHCPQGHKYTEENTYVCPRGKRSCRTCQRDLRRVRDRARTLTPEQRARKNELQRARRQKEAS